ncbi:ABC transporter related [Anaeromyxobacter dehalogenans 2CP-1]|uniref:ABC transporter related n=1 Tax=Anaeromyxobacter dehalogenans (strain ATCC BAA-258 / DSM 21875 / 2CP-1) TaxID=455488 RepID=B8J8A9_ANAD2|nr:ABC transporter ATP-binding protein [Anaeromyxobacter dehalogenans]ACL65408.1 ABC transporter related [Anaeromyxobacter dehalogenans 2CP-1]
MTPRHARPPRPTADASFRGRIAGARTVFRQVPGTLRLVWDTDRRSAIAVAALTLVSALLPAAMAWVGKLIVDGVVASARSGLAADRVRVLWLVAAEAGLMGLQLALARLLGMLRELMRAGVGNVINERILEKAVELELRHFEDAEVYDKMQNARREASARPLSLAMQAFAIGQNAVTLAALSGLLLRLSPASVLVIVAASIPAFVAEARLSAESFRVNTWRAPEGRKLNYLEWILTRDSHVKEVKLFGLGPLVLGRYRALFRKFFEEDRRIAIRRMRAGVAFGLVSLAAFYGMYALMAGRAAQGAITLGDLTLYIAVFRQGQGAVQAILSAMGGMYEDALFMSNLFAFLGIPTGGEAARVRPALSPPRGRPGALELRDVSFRYPGKQEWALRHVTLTLAPGEKLGLVGENGAGKSTLVKLLLRLYEPTEGAILYGGVDLRDMDPADLRSRIGAVFQDFVRYQFTAAENIGLGNPLHVDDRPRIEEAARRGGAEPVIDALPQRYDTVLGGWFERGHEISAGQWQKLAIARAFMREAEVLILDEPTASIDAEAEHELFHRFQALAAHRSAIVISHRFSTVRIADRIGVLHGGHLEELGTHQELIARDGRYAHLFHLQAQGYLD